MRASPFALHSENYHAICRLAKPYIGPFAASPWQNNWAGGKNFVVFPPARGIKRGFILTKATNMVSYKELGLVNTRELFKKAIDGKYAIPAFNFNNMEQMQAIIQACVEQKSPVILQVSSGARKYANQTLLRYMAQGAGLGKAPDRAAPRPRRHFRTLQVLRRLRILFRHDRRIRALL